MGESNAGADRREMTRGQVSSDQKQLEWEQALERVEARFKRDGFFRPGDEEVFEAVKAGGPKPYESFPVLSMVMGWHKSDSPIASGWVN